MTADVVLSHPSAEDAVEFITAARASKAAMRPWVDPADSPVRYSAYLDRAAREDTECFLVRHRECGELVGFVNINSIVRAAFRSGYLGYAGFISHRGRGLMSAGVSAVVSLAFADLGLHRLEANIQPDNAGSLGLVQRLGFSREGYSPQYLMIDGQWRDHERWAVRADTWTGRADGPDGPGSHSSPGSPGSPAP
jgi:[ribosomal protein S5]-alanine N-acetyltransferase